MVIGECIGKAIGNLESKRKWTPIEQVPVKKGLLRLWMLPRWDQDHAHAQSIMLVPLRT